MEPSVPGPDGFLVSSGDRLRGEHLRLDDYLLAEEQRAANQPFNVAIWRKVDKRKIANQIEAVLRRTAWLDQHDAELENGHLARTRLATLLRVLYSLKAPYSEPDLRMLLDLTVPVLHRIAPDGPVERVAEYLPNGDLTPELCAALRRFQASLTQDMGTSQSSIQSLRQQLHMLLWLDEWEPLDPARCWSECVRRDFRAFDGDRRVKWRAALKHIRGNAPVRMPAGWARGAQQFLAAIGIEDFREQMQTWFAPFRSGEPLPLSVAGGYVIKGLIWFCAVARDQELKECCLGLLEAKWKQKRNTEKVLVALGEFGITKEELRSRSLIKAPPPNPAPRLIEKMLNAKCSIRANHIQMDPDGELIVIQGQLHFYRLFRSTGRIERVSDNAVLELNWTAIPDQIRLHLSRECDSPQQVDLRAHFLMHDSVYGRYFTAK